MEITLSATADPETSFHGWSGGGCTGTDPCTLEFHQEDSVRAVFGTPTFSIGGQVAGLVGQGLVLQNSDGEQLNVTDNGPFDFSTPQLDGTPYAIAVVAQPTQPPQSCAVEHGTGHVQAADVEDISVSCTLDYVFASGFE
jgi:hypothetical protein